MARKQGRTGPRRTARAARGAGAFFKHSLASVGWLVSLVLAVLLAAALATYTPTDPGFSATGTAGARNLCGLLGAWVSDFLYWLLGRSAWWVVAALFVSGFSLVRFIWAKGDAVTLRIHPLSATSGRTFRWAPAGSTGSMSRAG